MLFFLCGFAPELATSQMCCERLPGNRPSFSQLQHYLQRLRETQGESIFPASMLACPLNEDPSHL